MAITRIGPNQSINLASNITGTLATGNGGTGATSFAPGKVLQVITATDSTPRNTTSTSFVTASNSLTVNITPSSSSNKVYVSVSSTIGNTAGGGNCMITLYRGSTNLGSSNGFIGAYAGSSDTRSGGSFGVLDSPSSTSQLTYQVYIKRGDGTRGDMNWNSSKGTITAFEIAG